MSATIKAVDPRTGEDGHDYREGTRADVDEAVTAAARAAHDPALADAARRAALLRGIAQGLEDRQVEVIASAGAESGLPEARLTGELARTAGQLRAFADVIEAGDHHDAIIDTADSAATPPRPDIRRTTIPIGPVAVFGASNFPLAFSTAGGDTASALAAGCPVVVKGHPAHPGTTTMVADIINEAVTAAGLPEGTFGHVLAASHDVAGALVDHPEVRAVAFTGSGAGGRALMDRAAARPVPIPVFAEMGSLNPVVITEAAIAARADAIVEALTGAIANFGGQLCTKPGLVFVPKGDAGSAFTDALAAAIGAREREVLLAQTVRDGFSRGVQALESAPGVSKLTDAESIDRGAGFHARPSLYSASASDFGMIDTLGEEHFGPAAIVLTYTSLDEAAAALTRSGGQLTATVHAQPQDHEALRPLVDAATRVAGRVIFDGVPTGVAVTWGMHHGGPYPAASDGAHTSVGMTALRRFRRPVVYQDAPQELLPPELRDGNPMSIPRRVDGVLRQP
jgi:NADP-dependent aldehyde dehydrogenase